MKEEFIKIYNENISRDGSQELLQWLSSKDFFEAPASTRFHLSQKGGLCEHSINVYNRLDCMVNGLNCNLANPPGIPIKETIAICGLLHDVCKVDFYKTDYRNVKDDRGIWQKIPYYTIEDHLPYGHGEKSVYIISRFMRLTCQEAMAIRWHMGFSDDSVKGGSYSCGNAFSQYPLAVALHVSDLQATYFDEREDK